VQEIFSCSSCCVQLVFYGADTAAAAGTSPDDADPAHRPGAASSSFSLSLVAKKLHRTPMQPDQDAE
jgi:hypothetical protein